MMMKLYNECFKIRFHSASKFSCSINDSYYYCSLCISRVALICCTLIISSDVSLASWIEKKTFKGSESNRYMFILLTAYCFSV